MNKIRSHYFVIFVLRVILLFLIFALCRVVFAIYNWDLIAPFPLSEVWSVVKGGFIFDSASIFYINALFVICSLMPFRFRERASYQNFLMWLFLIVNGIGLMINIADIYYFEFKLARITSDDLHFLSGGNFGALLISFAKDYWSALVLWMVCMILLWRGLVWLRYTPVRNRLMLHPVVFFILQTLLLGVVGVCMIFAIRGFSFSQASYPITMSDASLYVNPRYASLTLSNPFCVIRTFNHKVEYPRYLDEADLDSLHTVTHQPLDSVRMSIEGKPNVVIIVLESFGSAHIKSFSDQFPLDQLSYTPFFDSLARESYMLTNAFQNGIRSIDALPAIWASIPSFKTQFLSLPNSIGEYQALPRCLADMGYRTMFMHGAVRKSMSFVSFGQMAGVQEFYSREDYEAENGDGDSDGKWGIWDHKFLPFAQQKINETSEPFCATIFTLSSHHPYMLPKGMEGQFARGTEPIHPVISYSDAALREFFTTASKQQWFKNTLFVLTADHGSGADNDKYRQPPYSYAVPIMFYYPGEGRFDTETGRLVGQHTHTSQHIDIMPTLLRMVGYKDPFFGFGRDVFNEQDAPFAINYYGGAFNYLTDSMRYVFNEHDVVGLYNYKKDPFERHNMTPSQPSDSANITHMKAFIQQYYLHVKRSDFSASAAK